MQNDTWSLRVTTLITALIFSISSISFSASFGFLLGTTPLLSFVFAAMLIAVALSEFAAIAHIAFSLKQRNLAGVIGGAWLLFGGLAINILAGQSALQNAVDAEVSSRLTQSDEYKVAALQRTNAADKMAALSVSEEAVNAAHKNHATASQEKQSFLNSTALNSNGKSAGQVRARIKDCSGSGFYVNKYCPTLRNINDRIAKADETLVKQDAYLNAKQHHDTLLTTPLPNAVENAMLPGITSLALTLGVNAKLVSANVFLFIAIFCEISAIILWYFYSVYSPISAPLANAPMASASLNAPMAKPLSMDLFSKATILVSQRALEPSRASLRKWNDDIPDGEIYLWQKSWLAIGLIEPFETKGKQSFTFKSKV